MSILTEVPTNRQGPVQGDTDATGRIIIQTLEEFGIKTELKTVECGPSVTRFELIPAPGVKVERIAAFARASAAAFASMSTPASA